MKSYFQQIKVVFRYLVLALLLFEVTRVLFIIFNFTEFPELAGKSIFPFLFHGFRFDLSAVLYLNLPLLLLGLLPFSIFGKYNSFILQVLFVIGTGIGLVLNMYDIIYFQFTGKRIGWDMFEMTKTVDQGPGLIWSFILDYWYLPVCLIILFFFLIRALKKQALLFPVKALREKLLAFPVYLLLLGIAVVGLRGGVQTKPLKPIHAGNMVQASFIPIILNGPFSLLQGKQSDALHQHHYFDQAVSDEIIPYHKCYRDSNFEQKNVVFIVLESFNKDIIGKYHQGNGYTPFLDSLLEEGLDFTNCFANGRKSIEGIPAILSGIPALTSSPLISSSYGSNYFPSLSKLLNDKYATGFCHGAAKGSMYFDSYCAAIGTETYLGLEDYPDMNDYDGSWGIYDTPYLSYVIDEINQLPQPFFQTIFTLSSHHPYKLPEADKSRYSKKGEHPIIATYRYTDQALKSFFEKASKQVWFHNTLFVITADHTTGSKNKDPQYKTLLGKYRIPLLFYAPGDTNLTGTSNKVTQQIDIIPTVLDYLNYPDTVGLFGQSVFGNEEGYAIAFLNKIHMFVMGDYYYLFDGTDYKAVYAFKTDSILQNNLLEAGFVIPLKVDSTLKALIQSFNFKMVTNTL